MPDYDVAFHHATAHGVMTAIRIPESPEPVPETVLARLCPAEAAFARTLRGYRQVQFVGGRIAMCEALSQLGVPTAAVLPDPRGAPQLPPGTVGSISHKSDLAVALVARDVGCTVGVDVEDYEPARPSIAEQVLTPGERDAIAALPEARRWIALLLRFSIKEAAYKALDPHVRRHVGFQEVSVTPDLHGWAQIEMHLANAEGPFWAEGRYDWLHGRLVTSVRIRPPVGSGRSQSGAA